MGCSTAIKRAKFLQNTLCEKDIMDLELSLKAKAKLLSKINGKMQKKLSKTAFKSRLGKILI